MNKLILIIAILFSGMLMHGQVTMKSYELGSKHGLKTHMEPNTLGGLEGSISTTRDENNENTIVKISFGTIGYNGANGDQLDAFIEAVEENYEITFNIQDGDYGNGVASKEGVEYFVTWAKIYDDFNVTFSIKDIKLFNDWINYKEPVVSDAKTDF